MQIRKYADNDISAKEKACRCKYVVKKSQGKRVLVQKSARQLGARQESAGLKNVGYMCNKIKLVKKLKSAHL